MSWLICCTTDCCCWDCLPLNFFSVTSWPIIYALWPCPFLHMWSRGFTFAAWQTPCILWPSLVPGLWSGNEANCDHVHPLYLTLPIKLSHCRLAHSWRYGGSLGRTQRTLFHVSMIAPCMMGWNMWRESVPVTIGSRQFSSLVPRAVFPRL